MFIIITTILYYYTITEPIIGVFVLEGTLKGHLLQFLCNEQGHSQLDQMLIAMSSLTLGVSMDGHTPYTTSLDNLC